MKIALGLAAFALVLTSGAQARAADIIIDRDRQVEQQRSTLLPGATAPGGIPLRVMWFVSTQTLTLSGTQVDAICVFILTGAQFGTILPSVTV